MREALNMHYLAGYIDGEGCIGVAKVKARMAGSDHRYCPYLIITNTNFEILERIKFMYPLGRKILKNKKIEGRRQVYNLRIDGNELRRILSNLIPFLIEKKNQAILLLDFMETLRCKHEHRKKIPYEILQKRKWYYETLKMMKKNPTEAGLPILEAGRVPVEQQGNK